ncbi:MAG: hypothetical protein KatS3mg031_2664 [Chitinophagales bacterium]|nr:MAG: hypothetical protein KatS3mg031_2664 [Chitinophagales bacterium]
MSCRSTYIPLCLLPVLLMLSGCLKDELPVPPHSPGEVITASVDLEPTYRWQVYYDLDRSAITDKHLKTVWDLGFETSAEGFHVILNTSKLMFACNTGNPSFAEVNDTSGFFRCRKWDEASGNPDSTAIGDWRGHKNVYLIDRGLSETGQSLGFRKIKFLEVNDRYYRIRLAHINGSEDTVIQIFKDTSYNFMFLSFDNKGQVVKAEPPKSEWDLCFTQYTHIFYDTVPVTPYLVTGCLLNRYNTVARMITSIPFQDIDFTFASSLELSDAVNTIGYDWKRYDFKAGAYTVLDNRTYVIRDAEGTYFKLRFIDFYNALGQSGSPRWEYQRL